jgi:hypothetical protein
MSLFGNAMRSWTRSFHSGRALRHTETQHERQAIGHALSDFLGRQSIAAAVILECLAPRLGLASALVELRSGAEAAIYCARVEQASGVRLVASEVRALVRDLFIPREAEPFESLEDRTRALVRAARAVRVLDAKQELATVLPGEEPVVECRARAADVQIARW